MSESQFFNVAPPISGSGVSNRATQRHGVLRLATSASSQRVNIPDAWKGRFVTFQAVGLPVQILFGGAALSVTADQVSAVATEDATLNAASGYTIPEGQERPWRIPDNASVTDFAFISTGTTGFLEAYPSSSVIPDKT